MKTNKVDRYKLCEDLGFKYSTVSEWLQASKYPRIEKIEAIAKYFDVKKSELIENKDDRIPQKITNDDLKFALFGDVDTDDEILEDLKKMAQIHYQLRKNKEDEENKR